MAATATATAAAAAASRLVRIYKPLHFEKCSIINRPSVKFQWTAVITARKGIHEEGEKKKMVVVKALVSDRIISEPQTKIEVDLESVVNTIADFSVRMFRHWPTFRTKSWRLKAETFVERLIVDCRFFALIAVAGSLLGSILCFVEGCFHLLQTYFEYFHSISQRTDQKEIVRLLIEAIDMYVGGTAMLFIGTGLHVLFVGSKDTGSLITGSNLFGLFHLKSLPTWMKMQSVTQAKSKIGQAVLMILQGGLLEKLKNVPMESGLDLVCFAGTVLFSSAAVFLLSRLSRQKSEDTWPPKWLKSVI